MARPMERRGVVWWELTKRKGAEKAALIQRVPMGVVAEEVILQEDTEI